MHSLQTMSVVAKQQKAVQEQLYEYQVRQARFAVFDTVTSSIHERLHIFRTHHQKCVARRKNALGYEMRQENQRTEWLKRKYVDSVRQQQTMPARLDSAPNPRGFSDRSDQKEGTASDAPEQGSSKLSKHCNNKAMDSPPSSRNSDVNSNGITDTSVLIKREPESEDPPPSPPRVSLDMAHLSKNEGHSQGLELKRRLSQSVKNDNAKWNSAEDTRDELRLTAYDVIAGVINTHPIQPLEQDADCAHSNASSTSVKERSTTVQTNHSTVPATITSSSSLAKKKEQRSLVKDLDEFSKVMDQVTQEQKAKERRVSLGELETPVYPGPTSIGPRLHGPPPYQGIAETDYGQKYIPLQVAPTNQDPVYQPKNSAKSQLILPGLSDPPPVSSGNHLPVTPTTPLEHFSTFQSPHLPHAANNSPVLASPQACPPPPPYSSAAAGICYPYDSVYQSARSSVAEQWLPLQPHTQQPLQHSALTQHTQENGVARVSSCVVALAGQKRPGCELSSLPPTKLAYHPPPPRSNTSAPLHRYPDHPLYSPYPGSSSTFPH